MANDTPLNTPVLWINKYLQSKLADFGFDSVPFFPTAPSTIDNLTQSFVENNGVMATYDRMFKMNRKSFPHIKCEQLLYYFYATQENSITNMIQVTEIIYRLLDRFDESAEEINSWCSNRRVDLDDAGLVDNVFYFHNFRVYQLEETRDIIDFGTARTYAGNKIIIDFDYHQMPELTSNLWSPEPKLTGDDKITV
ncbi:MAG: hypothetical protein FJ356_00650 [Thaumarchaeota archaeon]|nr:hypothetical protein [Nitrososphaerota archaeon]